MERLLISILWAFIGVQQFLGIEDVDWAQATFFEKFIIIFLFMIFGPCIMISNVILGFIEILNGTWNNDDFMKKG